jgi:hypothetical protein
LWGCVGGVEVEGVWRGLENRREGRREGGRKCGEGREGMEMEMDIKKIKHKMKW